MRNPSLEFGVLPESPLGPIFFARSPTGLISLQFGLSQTRFLDELEARFGHMAVPGATHTAAIAEQLKAYFSGDRTAFDLPLDLQALSSFHRRVLRAAQSVPYGQAASYADIASQLGDLGAVRAVGQALAGNPIPIVIPCHRVIAADGKLGSYSGGGGVETKRMLLVLEGALMI